MRLLLVLVFFVTVSFKAQKIADSFTSIQKFGAKGDGKISDANAIQKAIDYAENNSIKSLVIPDGQYLLDKPLVFRKGGVQLIGTGALLREESWAKNVDKRFGNDKPFIGCTFIVPKNSTGIVYEKTVSDPVRITNIQFLAKEGRTKGKTTAIKFSSEFQGPTWPFIIERCHFRGFNYAVKFESANQYSVAFVQFYENAFSQNDECVYFSDLPNGNNTSAGGRNLTWGFTFQNNVCHDNSRVIRGAFGKVAVNILNNNMEGNIAYSDESTPKNIVDLEISHATVNFEGNHFEEVTSDCVSISSAFQKSDGSYMDYNGKSTGDEKNKVFIKGNNFDGIDLKHKPFILKSVLVYNYDSYPIYVDEADIRQNESNSLNIFLSDYAKKNGTTIKTATGKYENTAQSLKYISASKTIKVTGTPTKLVSPYLYNFLKVNKKNTPTFGTAESILVNSGDQLVGASFIVNNPNTSAFLGQVIFDISTDNGKTFQRKVVLGTYGTNLGFTTITGFYPVENLKNCVVKAALVTDIIGDTDIFVADKYTMFTIKKNSSIYAIPVFKY